MSNSKGKIAIITGATGGIGFEVAKRLGKDGYTVILNGIEDDAGAERVKELAAAGITSEYYGFDVTNEEQVTANIQKIGEKYGKIDVLVNNAGGLGGRSRFEEMTTEFYRFVMALNLDSTFFCSRAAIPFLKKSDYASIINYTSNAGWNAGGPGAGIYGTSKAGVHAITRALAKDLAEYGIRVNAVSPGKTNLPVFGVPVQSKALNGLDSLLSIAQMPGGVAVGTLAIGKASAKNAGLLAAQVIALNNPKVRAAVNDFRATQTTIVLDQPDPRG